MKHHQGVLPQDSSLCMNTKVRELSCDQRELIVSDVPIG